MWLRWKGVGLPPAVLSEESSGGSGGGRQGFLCFQLMPAKDAKVLTCDLRSTGFGQSLDCLILLPVLSRHLKGPGVCHLVCPDSSGNTQGPCGWIISLMMPPSWKGPTEQVTSPLRHPLVPAWAEKVGLATSPYHPFLHPLGGYGGQNSMSASPLQAALGQVLLS